MFQAVVKNLGALLALAAIALGSSVDHDIAEQVLQDYDRDVAPDHTDVEISYSLQRIVGLDIEKGILTLDLWFEMYWNDDRLQWNPSDFDNHTSVSVPADTVWIPDISLYNSASGFMNFDNRVRVIVKNDGDVVYIPPTEINSYCDTTGVSPCSPNVTCSLKFGSWTYAQQRVDLNVHRENAVMDQFHQFGTHEWTFADETYQRNVVSYNCCPDTYVDVTYKLTLTHNYS